MRESPRDGVERHGGVAKPEATWTPFLNPSADFDTRPRKQVGQRWVEPELLQADAEPWASMRGEGNLLSQGVEASKNASEVDGPLERIEDRAGMNLGLD